MLRNLWIRERKGVRRSNGYERCLRLPYMIRNVEATTRIQVHWSTPTEHLLSWDVREDETSNQLKYTCCYSYFWQHNWNLLTGHSVSNGIISNLFKLKKSNWYTTSWHIYEIDGVKRSHRSKDFFEQILTGWYFRIFEVKQIKFLVDRPGFFYLWIWHTDGSDQLWPIKTKQFILI